MHKSCALLIAAALALPQAAQAQCRINVPGTSCVAVEPTSFTPLPDPVEIGEVLERGEYSMMLNAGYYGLPPVSDGWVYMKIEHDIYRVDWRSHTVLEKVTDQASLNW